MKKYVISKTDNGTVEHLVMFGYDGGKWRIEFSSGDFFRPVTLYSAHEAYSLLNLIMSMHIWDSSLMYVDELNLDG